MTLDLNTLSKEELIALYEKQSSRLDKIIKQSDSQTKELVRLNEELLNSANTDPLTGAYNRRYFFDASKQLISLLRREKLNLTVAMIDIDLFKKVNDTYGHDIGDMVIKDLTEQIDKSLRTSDLFARFGGEEFVLLLSKTEIKEALIVTDKLRKAIELSCPIFDMKYTVSIGISQILDTDEDMDTAIKRADIALYHAKDTGRNKVVSYEELEIKES